MNRIFLMFYKRTLGINLLITIIWTIFLNKSFLGRMFNFLITFNIFGFIFSQIYEKIKFSRDTDYCFFHNKGYDKKRLIKEAIILNGVISFIFISIMFFIKKCF